MGILLMQHVSQFEKQPRIGRDILEMCLTRSVSGTLEAAGAEHGIVVFVGGGVAASVGPVDHPKVGTLVAME